MNWIRIESNRTDRIDFFYASMFGIRTWRLNRWHFGSTAKKISKKELNDRIMLDLLMQKHVWHKLLWFLSTWTSSWFGCTLTVLPGNKNFSCCFAHTCNCAYSNQVLSFSFLHDDDIAHLNVFGSVINVIVQMLA